MSADHDPFFFKYSSSEHFEHTKFCDVFAVADFQRVLSLLSCKMRFFNILIVTFKSGSSLISLTGSGEGGRALVPCLLQPDQVRQPPVHAPSGGG